MSILFFDLKEQYESIKPEINEAIQSVLTSSDFVLGTHVTEFTEKLASYYGVKHVIPVSNATDGLFIALKSLGITTGDEVITTACSWVSTVECIRRTGATPIIVDVDNKHLLDVDIIEEKITSKTKAILPVHLYGQLCDMKRITEICKQHNLLLVEDCAQAFKAEQDGFKAGTSGEAGVFSFYPTKNLGAYGDAGCIITNDDKLAETCTTYSNHGVLNGEIEEEGTNSRMDSLQAAILSVKLNYIDKWTNKRIKNALLYNELLRNIPEIDLPVQNKNSTHVYHIFVIECERREELMEHLNESGIQTKIHYPLPIPLTKAYNFLNIKEKDIPIAFKAHKRILSLPIYPELKKDSIYTICKSINEFYQR